MLTTAQLSREFRTSLADRFRRTSKRLCATRARNTDLIAWGKRFVPHYFTAPSSVMHKWLAASLVVATMERGSKLDIEAPRGSAKSTILTLVYPLWAICEGLEPFIMLFAETTNQAKRYLECISTELTENQLIAKAYPQVFGQGPTWSKQCIVTRTGKRVEANGAGRRIRGARLGEHRPSCCITDDPEGDDSAFSKIKRERIHNWYLKAIMKMGDEKSNHFLAGTRIHGDCLTAKVSILPGWKFKQFRSIMKWPTNMDLWNEWESIYCGHGVKNREKVARDFYLANRVKMDEGARVLWPEWESLYSLMCMRASDGHTSFESEKQNNPIDPSKCEWGDEYFKTDDIWFDEWPDAEDILVKVSSLDASKGQNDETSDFQAMIDIAVLKNGEVLVDSDMNRRPLDEMCAEYVQRITQHDSDAAVCEDNQFQELLLDDLELEAEVTKSPVPIQGMTNTKKKIIRIRRLSPLISRGKLRFKRKSKGNAQLIKQLSEFPNGEFDDGPDALEMAYRKACELVAGDPEAVVLENTF